MIPEKGSIRGAARMSGHDKGTICKWVDLAGKHCKEVTDYFSHEKHSEIKNGGLSPRFLNFFHFISCFGNYLNHGLQAHLINSRRKTNQFWIALISSLRCLDTFPGSSKDDTRCRVSF